MEYEENEMLFNHGVNENIKGTDSKNDANLS